MPILKYGALARKERTYAHGTIPRSTATQTWGIRFDHDDTLVRTKSHQLQNEPAAGRRGIREVASVGHGESAGTEIQTCTHVQLFGDSAASTKADEAAAGTAEVDGAKWHYTPGAVQD